MLIQFDLTMYKHMVNYTLRKVVVSISIVVQLTTIILIGALGLSRQNYLEVDLEFSVKRILFQGIVAHPTHF